jgi:tetratricopeptide (TPR) repeat protein
MNIFSKKTPVLRWFIASILLAIALAGCYDGPVWKNPISEPDPHSIDHDLLGTWGLIVDGKKYAVVHFEIADKKKGTIKAYLFNFRDSGSTKSDIYYGHFSRLGDSRYLNLYELPIAKPVNTKQVEKEEGSQEAPSYFFVKYEIKGKTLSMALMDGEFVMASIRNDEIKGITYGKGGVSITDESANIAEYIRKHEKDVFSSRLEFFGKFSLFRVRYGARELEILKHVKNWPLIRVKAEPDYDKIIELYPEDVDAYYQRGVAYKYKPDHEKAIRDFSKVIELSPKNADAYRNRGESYEAKGEHDMAIRDFSKAIELNPTNALAYENRGEAYKAKGDYDSAIREYSKAIELSEAFSDKAHIGRGDAYNAKGDYDSAIQDYSRVIQAYPDYYPDTFIKRGDVYKSKGDFEKAAQDYNNHGNALIKGKKDYDGAIQDYSKAIELVPQDAVAYKNRGNAYKAKGDYEYAFQDYSKAIELNPKDEYVYLLLIIASMKKTQLAYEDSIEKLRGYVNNNPSDEWVRTISKYYLGMDGLSERDVLKEARNAATTEEIRTRLCGAYYYLGEARWFKGDRQGAVAFFINSIDTVRRCDEADSAQANLMIIGIQF